MFPFAKEYGQIIRECMNLRDQKNHDYGDSWRYMRPIGLTDQLLIKVMRIRKLEELEAKGKGPLISEGIESELKDIINYATMEIIQLREGHK